LLKKEDIACLKQRIDFLEEKIINLRIGRRVLMNIIEESEKIRREEINRLKKEITKLKKSNRKYAELLSANKKVTYE
jgi:polyhydroxyalkanoate synthesis regulator phasin